MLEKAFIGTIDLEFIQKKKFFVTLLMIINGYPSKVDYQKLKDIKGITHDVLKTLPLISLEEENIIPFLLPKEIFKKRE